MDVPHEVDREHLLASQPTEAHERASLRDFRVSVHSTRIAQSLYGSIQEYAGFEREEWLG